MRIDSYLLLEGIVWTVFSPTLPDRCDLPINKKKPEPIGLRLGISIGLFVEVAQDDAEHAAQWLSSAP